MLPLKGIQILDLSRHGPGGYCTTLLADLGAEVIKVEEAGKGDLLRDIPPHLSGESAFYLALHRNKRCLTLNLKEQAGRDILYRLAANADALLETFRPGVTERLEIDYPRLSAINPRLVYCSLTGYGQTGPYRDLPGHDINYVALAGLLGLCGQRGGSPVVPPLQIADFAAGSLFAALGIVSAVFSARQTGKGQYLDTAMVDGTLSLMTLHWGSYLLTGEQPVRGEMTLSGGNAFYGIYETQDGKYVATGPLEEKFWRNFCQLMGVEQYLEHQFTPEKQEPLRQLLQARFRSKTRAQWEAELTMHEVCFMPVLEPGEVLSHPHVTARGMVVTMDHPDFGKLPQIANPIKLSAVSAEELYRTPPPKLGQHTDEILSELGLSVAEIKDLQGRGVV